MNKPETQAYKRMPIENYSLEQDREGYNDATYTYIRDIGIREL
jgi:hypothetical protein